MWKASVTVAKAGAADVVALFELAPPAPQAVLIAEDPFGPSATVEALYAEAPDAALLTRLVGRAVDVASLPDQDWIKQSQIGLHPVRAGRFFVYGAHDEGKIPCGAIAIRIEAGLAFGTGHHETTALCLQALSGSTLAGARPRVLDVGCGTGVLAIAAAKLWRVPVVATDIDPVAVEVARDNCRLNEVRPLVRTLVADGLQHPAIGRNAPYDVIVANILAAPLTVLARPLSAALARGGTAVLSGLLRDQEQWVLSYYRPQGLVLRRVLRDDPWSALVLQRK